MGRNPVARGSGPRIRSLSPDATVALQLWRPEVHRRISCASLDEPQPLSATCAVHIWRVPLSFAVSARRNAASAFSPNERAIHEGDKFAIRGRISALSPAPVAYPPSDPASARPPIPSQLAAPVTNHARGPAGDARKEAVNRALSQLSRHSRSTSTAVRA